MPYREVRRVATESGFSLGDFGEEDFAAGNGRFSSVSRFVEAAVRLGIIVPTPSIASSAAGTADLIARQEAHPLYGIYREVRDHSWIGPDDSCGCEGNLHRIADALAKIIQRDTETMPSAQPLGDAERGRYLGFAEKCIAEYANPENSRHVNKMLNEAGEIIQSLASRPTPSAHTDLARKLERWAKQRDDEQKIGEHGGQVNEGRTSRTLLLREAAAALFSVPTQQTVECEECRQRCKDKEGDNAAE